MQRQSDKGYKELGKAKPCIRSLDYDEGKLNLIANEFFGPNDSEIPINWILFAKLKNPYALGR